ncbi:MAG: FAD-binding protein [Dehalococcoidia bacterium]|nr:FAD-binding protein [Dehalococcoidia bacterium]
MKHINVDVAIVGSGIGGLCAAALLGKQGYTTLVVEKMPRIGGRWASVQYQGFRMCIGGIGAEIGTPFGETLKKAGVEFEVRPVDPFIYRIHGKDHQIPEKGGLRKLLSLCGTEEEGAAVMGRLRKAMSWQEPSASITLREWLLQYTRNDDILGLFDTMARGGMGLGSNECSAQDYLYFLKVGGGWRHWGIMPEGPEGITTRLEKVIENNGGKVWIRSRTKKIVTEKGRVKGILVEKDGQEIEVTTQAVISNAGPKKTIELVGAKNLEMGYVRDIMDHLIPVPWISVYTASDRPLMGPGNLMPTGTRRIFCAVCTTQICPEHAPPGQHLLETFSVPSTAFGPVDYRKELDLHVQDLKELFPDFEKHGRILMGSVYRGEWPCLRNVPGYSIPQKTPVELLYNVSDCLGGRGTIAGPGAVQSAKLAVEDLVGRIRPSG